MTSIDNKDIVLDKQLLENCLKELGALLKKKVGIIAMKLVCARKYKKPAMSSHPFGTGNYQPVNYLYHVLFVKTN